MGRGPSAMKLKGPLLTIILMYITWGTEAGLDRSSNFDNTDEDFPLEANANLLKLPGTLLNPNANSGVKISKKKRLRVSSNQGIITSPNFPNNYPNDVLKTYTIPFTSGDFVVIEFTDFNLEGRRGCPWDWVTIRDHRGNTLLPKTCESSIPNTIYAPTEKWWFPVEVIFHSDYSVTRKGFRLEWKSGNCQYKDWKMYKGSCYGYGKNLYKTWADAEDFCKGVRGHLASIHSEDELEFVQSNFPRDLWLGGSDAGEEGTWEWSDGSSWNYYSTYSAWSPGQPDNYIGNQDCLVGNWHHDLKWDDDNCEQKKLFLCKEYLPL